MAAIAPAITDISDRANGSTFLVQWTPVTEADTCNPVSFPMHSDKSIHVSGTFGGATVVLQGSNNSGTTYVGLRDPSSTAISMTADTIKAVLENTQLVKPSASGGSSQSLTISMLFHLSHPLRT